jgi:hypothetical protein
MAVTARAKAGHTDPGGAGDMAARVAGLEAENALLAAVLARLAVALAPGGAPASWQEIVTRELRVLSPAELAAYEAIVTRHRGG